ncbi:MAG: DEAD/DEAH box helicase [Mycoplasma sp.]|nr:DEAD/DEAH box helicase [Mycoplasma sp.]
MKFSEIDKINSKILNSLQEMNFFEMSPIQEKTIPLAIEGYDIIGQAQTGTGKTAAFGIPILNMLDPSSNDIEHLIIAPTRELASQIYNQLLKIGKYLDLRMVLIVGGISYEKQIKELSKKPNVLIGTPGRINDYLKTKRINISNVKTFTLDEVDELLNMGFKEDIELMISHLRNDCQNFFFTATFNNKIKALAREIVKPDHKNISVSSGLKTSNNIIQEYILVKEKTKFICLIKFLRFYNPKSIIIFCRTKKRVDELCEALNKVGFNAVGLHGDIQQKNRTFIMNQFKNNNKQILVATDVVARGIDINHIEWIVNFDLPQEIEYYTHRIGRVGRNNSKGYSLSFVKIDEIEHLREIEIKTNSKIKEIFLPSDEQIYIKWRQDVNSKFDEILKNSSYDNPKYLENELIKQYSHEQMAIIMSYYLLKDEHKYKKINLTPEPSVILKGQAKVRNIKNRINEFSNNKKKMKNSTPNSKKIKESHNNFIKKRNKNK